MAYNLTARTPGKSAMRPKNRVWGFSRNDRNLPLENRLRCPELRRKSRPTLTIFTPGIPQWPSRDPIGERGGVNLYGFVGNDGVSWWDWLGLDPGEEKFETHREAYLDAIAYVLRKGQESLDRGWEEMERLFGVTRDNFNTSPEKIIAALRASRMGKGYLSEHVGKSGFAESTHDLGIYLLQQKELDKGDYIIDWVFIMGREKSALVYCNGKLGAAKKYGYVFSPGALPSLANMRDIKGLAGIVAQFSSLQAMIPSGGIPLDFVHSHLVDRIDGSSFGEFGTGETHVGQSLGLSDADIKFFGGPTCRCLITVTAVEDNGKSQRIFRGGTTKWNDEE